MKNISKFIVGLFIITAPSSFAQEQSLQVTYLNGKAQTLESNTNKPTKIGDKILGGGSLKLDKDTQIELIYKTWHLRIAEPGIYKIAQLIDNLENQNAYALTNFSDRNSKGLASKYVHSAKPAGVAGSVAGVRSGTTTEKFKNEIDDLKRGVKKLIDGDSKQAVEVLGLAFESYTGSDPAFSYYYSLALLEEGQPNKAQSVIDNVDQDETSYVEIDGGTDPADIPDALVLLKGYILVNKSDFIGVDGWAVKSLERKIGIDTKQEVLMIQAMANGSLKKPQVWKDLLEQVITLDPTSDFGIQAKKLLQSAGK